MKVQSVQLKYFKNFGFLPNLILLTQKQGTSQGFDYFGGNEWCWKNKYIASHRCNVGYCNRTVTKNLGRREWTGFNYELLSNNWGKFEPEVTVKVQFSTRFSFCLGMRRESVYNYISRTLDSFNFSAFTV